MQPQKVIVAQYTNDWIQPYSDGGGGIPVVISSNHPQYQVGNRFDYGFLQVALAQGYTIIILSTGKAMTESEAEVYGEAEPVEVQPHL